MAEMKLSNVEGELNDIGGFERWPFKSNKNFVAYLLTKRFVKNAAHLSLERYCQLYRTLGITLRIQP